MSFDPAYLIRTGAAAAYTQRGPQLLIGQSFVMNLSLREIEVIHELRHSKDFQNELKRILSPYYGQALAQKGDLPGQGAQTYDRYIGFTEMNAHFESFRLQLNRVKRAVREGNREKIDEVATRLYRLALQGLIVSQRSYRIAETLELDLKDGAELHVSENNGILYVAWKVQKSPDSEFLVNFPLVHSKGAADPHNATYLKGQIALLKLASDRHWSQFDLVFRVIDLVKMPENRPHLPAILNALGQTVTDANWQRKIPEPVTIAQLLETFNANLKKAIESPQLNGLPAPPTKEGVAFVAVEFPAVV